MLSFRVFAARPPRRSPDSISNLAPISHPLSPNSFHCHRSEKTPVNSNHCHTSKIAACNPCVCHTSEPPRGLTLDVPTSKHLGVPNLQTCQQSNVPTIYPLSFHILANSFACFCICAKVNPFRFKRFRTLYQKNGVGILPTFQRSTFKPSNVPPVPLQPNSFGATIPKGTRFLYDPGKQLHSPRCLRIRERTSGTARSWSPLQVVPGSSVLRRVSGFVLQTLSKLDRSRVARATQPVQDGQLNRVGKAGSVRLG